MKKLFLFIGLFAGFAALLAGCSKDDTKDPDSAPPTPPPAATTRTIQFDVAYALQGETDGLSFAWANGDADKLAIVGESGQVVNSSKIEISDKSAVFTGEIGVEETLVYCFYPAASNASLTSAPFAIAAKRTQVKAGDDLEGTQLPLISNAVAIPAEGESVSVQAKAVPTILRLAVYSSEEVFQAELIKNIVLQCTEKINGTYTWNFSLQTGVVAEGAANSQVDLTNYYDLTGIADAEDAEPIYMTVAPVPVAAGYKYLISTNKASYVYTVSEANEFGMGEVLDVAIDLKDAERTEKGIITFDASTLDGYECDASASTAATEIGAFKVSVSGVESTDYAQEFYKKLTFSVKDAEGAAATWVTPTLGSDGKINLTWEMNPTGEVRAATITANFTLTDDSYWYDGNPAFKFSVKQKPTTASYDFNNIPLSARAWNATAEGFAERDLGWYFAKVNGSTENAPNDNQVFYNFDFEVRDGNGVDVTWAKVFCKDNNNHLYLLCEASTDMNDRMATISLYNRFSGEKEDIAITVNQHGVATPSEVTYKWNPYSFSVPPPAGITDVDAGYYLAYIDGSPNRELEWTPYYDLTYSIVDDNGEPVTWTRVKRNAGDSNHPLVSCDANTGGLRRAYIMASWTGNSYAQPTTDPLFIITVVQQPASGNYVTYTGLKDFAARQSGYNDVQLGTYHAFTNGSATNDFAAGGNLAYPDTYNITLTTEPVDVSSWITALSVSHPNKEGGANEIRCKMAKNDTGVPREVTVHAHYTKTGVSTFDPVFSFKIVQAEK